MHVMDGWEGDREAIAMNVGMQREELAPESSGRRTPARKSAMYKRLALRRETKSHIPFKGLHQYG
jgi:hypothetical protein